LTTSHKDGLSDTGATNDITIIHDYLPFAQPHDVKVFSTTGEFTAPGIQALEQGITKVISDSGNILNFPMIYTLRSSGTVFSHDSYISSCDNTFQILQRGSKNKCGVMEFLDQNDKLIDRIALRQTSNHKSFIDSCILLPPLRLIDAIPEDDAITTPIHVNSLSIDQKATSCNCAYLL